MAVLRSLGTGLGAAGYLDSLLSWILHPSQQSLPKECSKSPGRKLVVQCTSVFRSWGDGETSKQTETTARKPAADKLQGQEEMF